MAGSKKIILYIIALMTILTAACNQSEIPKPRGFFRIDFPDKSYVKYLSDCPFRFDYPVYGIIVPNQQGEPCWLNIEFPAYGGTIYLSYKRVNGDLESLQEDAHKLAYKHTVKADAIEEQVIDDPTRDVYGIFWDIRGNAASSVQFFVTDSTYHYLRGSLYFATQPKKDSLAPVIDFFRDDVLHLVETLEWVEK